jgi:hypothetical protein
MTDISNGRTSLIKVVLALGEYLTSEESELRRKGEPDELDFNQSRVTFPTLETGVEFLSLVLQRSPPETMNRQSGVYFNSSRWFPSLRRRMTASSRSDEILLRKIGRFRDRQACTQWNFNPRISSDFFSFGSYRSDRRVNKISDRYYNFL